MSSVVELEMPCTVRMPFYNLAFKHCTRQQIITWVSAQVSRWQFMHPSIGLKGKTIFLYFYFIMTKLNFYKFMLLCTKQIEYIFYLFVSVILFIVVFKILLYFSACEKSQGFLIANLKSRKKSRFIAMHFILLL